MSLKMKLNIVNKHEYEEGEGYIQLTIDIPKETEKLEEYFNFLGLDYNNLSIGDTHVLGCEVIDTDDPHFSDRMSTEMSNIITIGNKWGWTTPYQYVKEMFKIINSLNTEERYKLLAVLEMKKEQICNMKDAIKYGNNLECFEYYDNIGTYQEYAQKLIDNGDICLNDVVDFINMEELGEAYVNGNEGVFTNQGLIFEASPIENNIKNSIYQGEEEQGFE